MEQYEDPGMAGRLSREKIQTSGCEGSWSRLHRLCRGIEGDRLICDGVGVSCRGAAAEGRPARSCRAHWLWLRGRRVVNRHMRPDVLRPIARGSSVARDPLVCHRRAPPCPPAAHAAPPRDDISQPACSAVVQYNSINHAHCRVPRNVLAEATPSRGGGNAGPMRRQATIHRSSLRRRLALAVTPPRALHGSPAFHRPAASDPSSVLLRSG